MADMYRNNPPVFSALSKPVPNMQVKGQQDEDPMRNVGRQPYISPDFDQN
jgi:hypothetical protein